MLKAMTVTKQEVVGVDTSTLELGLRKVLSRYFKLEPVLNPLDPNEMPRLAGNWRLTPNPMMDGWDVVQDTGDAAA